MRQQYAADLNQTEAVCACGRQPRRRRLDTPASPHSITRRSTPLARWRPSSVSSTRTRSPVASRSERVSALSVGPEDRVIQVASRHQIADKAALSRALGVVVTRIPHDQVRIALVADAREWI